MDDLTLTFLIILAAAALAALILLSYRRNRKITDEELSKYCLQMGYSYDRDKNSSQSTIRIQGEHFRLESMMKSLRNSAEDDARRELMTRWDSIETDSWRPAFIIGSAPAAGDWNQLPDALKNMATESLSAQSGLTLDPKQVKMIQTDGKSRFLLFEQSPGAGDAALQRLQPLLSQWSDQQTIFIKSAPDGVTLSIHNYFIRNVALLEKLLALAKAI